MKLTHLKDGEQVPINIGAHKLFAAPKAEVIHLRFKPGEVLEKHTNPFDVVFYVLEGTGTLAVNDEIFAAGPDTLIEVSAPELRGWTNAGSTDLRVLVIKLL
jgi:quercetin dioxygenase-like cupin family protein